MTNEIDDPQNDEITDVQYESQKMESLGRLTGGVAHDLNNALNVILGFADLAKLEVDKSDTIYEYLMDIIIAAKQASAITKQLQAFSRMGFTPTKALDLNKTLGKMVTMLNVLITGGIDLKLSSVADLWPVKMSESQFEQIISTLCIKARNYVDGGGVITIRTQNITFREKDCQAISGCRSGDFVELTMSCSSLAYEKSGKCGDDAHEKSGRELHNIEEIVQNNDGFLKKCIGITASEMVKVYLPAYKLGIAEGIVGNTDEIPMGNGETILLVEDDIPTLKITKILLERLGYVVLPVSLPEKAIDVAKKHTSEIQLLITDLGMPLINGRELALRLRVLYPELPCMFMSGHSAKETDDNGAFDGSSHFIQKPFFKGDLAIAVRKALDT